ncbi:hypothetical protein Daura_25340 [Dactylosporangium aurantiacum]|uniref:Uncharacterized protein n=1 Tax=Dactylosporangium aurantiacum TaxID=35754 RepID=A0A9Q9IN19_9ACTN|nr:hypothetical protein [Dactylosporangium aurantiacum]MDG6107945.1 hypothetical protein [Dactylosporangium aurantiacum]UWZ59189.1 hypothetical protein Daura_25340 [Dactylosporangium aurantiacum]
MDRATDRLERVTVGVALAWVVAVIACGVAAPDLRGPGPVPAPVWIGAPVTVAGAVLVAGCLLAWAVAGVRGRRQPSPSSRGSASGAVPVGDAPRRGAMARGGPALVLLLLGIGLVYGAGKLLFPLDEPGRTAPAGVAPLGRLWHAAQLTGLVAFAVAILMAAVWAAATTLTRAGAAARRDTG